MPQPCSVLYPALFVLVALLAVARAGVVGWTANTGSSTTFRTNVTYYINFQGNGSDVGVTWSGDSASFAETTTLVRACEVGNSQPACAERSRASPTSANGLPWHWPLDDLVSPGQALVNVTVSLIDAATNRTVDGGAAWGTVWNNLGRNAANVSLTASTAVSGSRLDVSGTFKAAVEAIALTYTCRWTATLANSSAIVLEAPLTSSAGQYYAPRCVVPPFDNRLPAGTNFALALLVGSGPDVVPPPAVPVVLPTGSLVTHLSLPVDLCYGQNVSLAGFFSTAPGTTYSCTFRGGSKFDTTANVAPVSSTLIECPLPDYAGRIDQVAVLQFSGSATTYIGIIDKTFAINEKCGGGGGDDDDDKWPYWAWILVGLGAVAGLTTAMGLAALAYIRCCRRFASGEYEQLVYADNPIHYAGEQQLPIDRKTFSA